MADDNRILQMVLEVKDQDVVKATTNVAALESRIKKLVKAEQDGKYTDAQFAAGKQQITNSLSNMANVSKNKAERAVRSLINTERALTREVKVNTVALSSNAKASQNAGAAMNQYGTVSGLAGKKLNTFNMKIQQGGYQLQDFVVQMQSGTSFFTAFAQQGSQFAGVFGPTGAVVGAIIAIGSAIGGIAYNSMKGTKEVKALKEQFEALATAVGDLSSVEESLTKALELPVDRANQKLVNYLETLKRVKVVAAQTEFSAAMKPTIMGFQEESAGLNKDLSATYRPQGRGGAAQLRLTGQERKDAEDRLKLVVELNNEFISIADGPVDGMAKKLLDFENRLRNSGRLTKGMQDTFYNLLETTGLRAEYQIELERLSEKENDNKKLGAKIMAAAAQVEFDDAIAANKARIESDNKRYARGMFILSAFREEQARNSAALEESQTQDYSRYMLILSAFQQKQAKIEVARLAYADKYHAHIMAMQNAQYADLKKKEDEFNTKKLANLALQQMAIEFSTGGQARSKYTRGYVAPETKDPKTPKDKTLSGTTLDVLEAESNARQAALRLGDAELAMYERQLSIRQALGDYVKNYTNEEIEAAAKLFEVRQKEEDQINRIRQRNEELAGTIAQTMGDSLMSIVDGTMSVKDAFKSMASDIIRELYRVLVVQELVFQAKMAMKAAGWFADGGAFSGGNQLANANGNGFSGGNVIPFASGGVVGSPTTFGMSGGRTGLMGEAGPEAIMPLKRGSDGKLGVSMNGGDSSVTVVQNINISTGVQQTVRAEIKSMMPEIANNAKAAVLDAKRRGGSYGGAFA